MRKILLLSIACVGFLYAGVSANEKFISACKAGNLKEVRYLVSHGVNPNTTDDEGDSGITRAGISDHLDIIKYLVSKGVSITSMAAAGYGQIKIVKYLVNHGAHIDAKDNNGDTAMINAAGYGYLKTVKYLILRGADVHAKDNNGVTALMGAASSEHENLELIKYLRII